MMEELVRWMRAMVLLQIQLVHGAAGRGDLPPLKLEVLLADAGFNAKDIAVMLEKSPAAVAKAISRARAARRSAESGAGSDVPSAQGEGPDA